ncbi:MAG: uroporphyrinogen decarboxylase family protein [Gemmatimonadota bacterium]
MTSVERVLTALRGGEPDRVPIVESVVDERVRRALFPDAWETGAFSDAIGLDAVGAGLDYRRSDETETGYRDEWGVTYRKAPQALSHPVRGPIASMDDLRGYQPPDPEAPWRLGAIPDLVARYKGRKAITLHHRAAFMWAAYLAGLDHLLMWFALDPELAHALLDRVLETNIAAARRAIRAGVEVVILGDDYAHNWGPMMSPAHFDEFVAPRLQRMVESVHEEGALCVKHTDGNIWAILDSILAAGPDAINPLEPVAGMEIGKVKAYCGDRVCLMGNIDCGELLSHGTPAQVREAVRACIAAAAPGGGFILSSSNSIHSSVEPANYLEMVRAGNELGAYPLRA